jgi:hypothetical protein
MSALCVPLLGIYRRQIKEKGEIVLDFWVCQLSEGIRKEKWFAALRMLPPGLVRVLLYEF